MIGYVCKYTPVELLTAMGADLVRLEPTVKNFNQADTYLHPNICSYTKAVLEEVMNKDFEGVILTDCCDSMRRLFDALTARFPDKFFFLLNVPRKVNDFAVTLYQKQLEALMAAYAQFQENKNSLASPALVSYQRTPLLSREVTYTPKHLLDHSATPYPLQELLRLWQEQQLTDYQVPAVFSISRFLELLKYQATQPSFSNYSAHTDGINIGLMGARCQKAIIELLEQHQVNILFDLTCTGMTRAFPFDQKQLLPSYAASLLNQIPCMRMMKATGREQFLDGFRDRLDGIIYHSVKFCDMYSYEYAALREDKQLPLLPVETDSTLSNLGQIRTRVEAFLEELQLKQNLFSTPLPQEGTPMYVMGIDSGSTSTNAVILDQDKNIVAYHVLRTGAKAGESSEEILKITLEKAGLQRQDLSRIVATGYGRVSIPFADANVTEITCHGKGAHFVAPKVRTILDIGGQDSKAIKLDAQGNVIDFVMNDKCAAGTGRFLEAMARTLELPIDQLGPVSLEWKEDLSISSMCTVFAESEVISMIAVNKEKSDIAHGVHKAISGKAMSLLKKVGLEGEFMMTGGVAKNPGVVHVLEEALHARLFIYQEPEIIGALGAALFALE